MQRGVLPSYKHSEQVYFIFLRFFSLTATTVLSSKSMNSVIISNADCGHFSIHLPHPLHLTESITI